MDFLSKELQQYVTYYTEPESDLLAEINRDTFANVLQPRMLSGHLQGRVLSMICSMIKPNYILEIGTYTGYSAICMAEHISRDGKLITIDVNEELEDRVRNNFKKSQFDKKIEYIIGDALKIIPTLSEKFDLVFIDADKKNYSRYFDLVIDILKPNGYIIADNVLWSGKVVDASLASKDKELNSILEFNKKIQLDGRVSNVLFPIRDGLMICRKIS